MAEAVPTRLSRGVARRFGLVVGAAFFLLGGLAWWRGRPLMAQVLGGIGAALLVSGVIAPEALSPVYRVWMRAALALSSVTTPILLGLVYFGIITPIGALRRLLGQDSLASRAGADSFWVGRPDHQRQRPDMEHQF